MKYLFLSLLVIGLVGCNAKDVVKPKTTLNPNDPNEVLVIETTQRHDGIGCTVWAGMATERAAEPDEGKCKTILVENSTTRYTLTCLQQITGELYKVHCPIVEAGQIVHLEHVGVHGDIEIRECSQRKPSCLYTGNGQLEAIEDLYLEKTEPRMK